MEYTEETYWNSFPNLSREIFFESEKEFQTFMERIDQKLIDENIPPKGRQIKGISEVAKALNTEIPWVENRFAKKDDYSILSLAAHISIWFQNKYETRLNMGFSSKSMVKLKGDCYVLNIPHSWGEPKLSFNTSSEMTQDESINIAECIEGLTDYIIKRITHEEIKLIAVRLSEAIFLTQILDRLINIGMLKEAKSDFIQSVETYFRDQCVPGLSKWHSLQFSEKVLKAFIGSKGEKYGYTHNLSELLKKAADCGLSNVEKYDVKIIQCKPEVRYGSDLVSAEDAYNAHIEAIKLAIYTLAEIND